MKHSCKKNDLEYQVWTELMAHFQRFPSAHPCITLNGGNVKCVNCWTATIIIYSYDNSNNNAI